MTIPEVARELGVNEKTVRRWVQSGQLEATQNFVGRYDITREALDAFIEVRNKQREHPTTPN